MRKCPKCGKEYDNTWSVCLGDGEKLIESSLKTDKETWIRKAITFGYTNFKQDIDKYGQIFIPDRNYYFKNKDIVLAVQEMARDLLSKIGLVTATILVTFESNLNIPGRVELSNRECFIDISNEFRFKPYSIGAILAHEIMHVFLHNSRISFGSSTEENELFTDVMITIFGLGLLVLNGFEEETKTEETILGTQTTTKSRFLGYLQPYEFGYLTGRLIKFNNLDVNGIFSKMNNPGLKYLQEGISKATQELKLKQKQGRFYRRNKKRINKIYSRLNNMAFNSIEQRDGYLAIGIDYDLKLSTVINCDKCFSRLRVPVNKGKIKVKCRNCDHEISVVT